MNLLVNYNKLSEYWPSKVFIHLLEQKPLANAVSPTVLQGSGNSSFLTTVNCHIQSAPTMPSKLRLKTNKKTRLLNLQI